MNTLSIGSELYHGIDHCFLVKSSQKDLENLIITILDQQYQRF